MRRESTSPVNGPQTRDEIAAIHGRLALRMVSCPRACPTPGPVAPPATQ